MLTRNDHPLGFPVSFATDANFNFATDSVFTNVFENSSGILTNEFLLLDGEAFDLLDGTNFLLL